MGGNRKTRQLKEQMMVNIVKRLEDRIAFATPTKEPEEGSNEQVEEENNEIVVEEPEVEVVPRGLEQELAEEEKAEQQEIPAHVHKHATRGTTKLVNNMQLGGSEGEWREAEEFAREYLCHAVTTDH